jgi:protein SCO1/2
VRPARQAKAWLAAVTLLIIAAPAPAGPHGSVRLDEEQALAASKAAVGNLVGDHAFVDHRGRPVRLSQLRGKPLIVPMVYTGCYHTCPLIAHSLLKAVAAARQSLPRESFEVAVVGFEAGVDTPARMRAFAANQGLDQPGWTFLSGDRETIDGLARDIGFMFVRSPRGFDHIAQTTVIDGGGRVYWQVYGAEFKTSAVMEPLKQLVYGRPVSFREPSTWWDRLRLLCTVYDPTQDRYRFSYAIFVGIFVGIASLMGTAWFLAHAWRRRSVQRT